MAHISSGFNFDPNLSTLGTCVSHSELQEMERKGYQFKKNPSWFAPSKCYKFYFLTSDWVCDLFFIRKKTAGLSLVSVGWKLSQGTRQGNGTHILCPKLKIHWSLTGHFWLQRLFSSAVLPVKLSFLDLLVLTQISSLWDLSMLKVLGTKWMKTQRPGESSGSCCWTVLGPTSGLSQCSSTSRNKDVANRIFSFSTMILSYNTNLIRTHGMPELVMLRYYSWLCACVSLLTRLGRCQGVSPSPNMQGKCP